MNARISFFSAVMLIISSIYLISSESPRNLRSIASVVPRIGDPLAVVVDHGLVPPQNLAAPVHAVIDLEKMIQDQVASRVAEVVEQNLKLVQQVEALAKQQLKLVGQFTDLVFWCNLSWAFNLGTIVVCAVALKKCTSSRASKG